MSLFGVFGAVALVELVVFVLVERQIGLVAALLIALGTALLGSVLVRRAGVAVMARFRERLSSGSLPGRELTHGAAVLVSGALLISPGFFTDIIGFLLLVPSVRDGIHEWVRRRFKDRMPVVGDGPTVIDVDAWEDEA
ncbi:MAG: FxsA family protein [Acidimicrobiia bacterium]|nr:FxsA family protein [Acidimicrobiia bacterium]